MQNEFIISLLQMNIIPGSAEHNLRVALDMAKKAVQQESRVIALPEMWSTDFLSLKDRKLAETTPQIIKDLSSFAKENHIFILGTMPELAKNKMYNTLYTIDPSGKTIGKYRKANLFKLTGEHLTYSPGKITKPLKTELGTFVTATCFDIRFPDFINKVVNAQEGIR